jgi:hypothetical protein
MDYARNLIVSVPLALLLLVLSFFGFASQTTMHVQNIQQPLSATERGFPLPYQYQYNCPFQTQAAYCSVATLPVHVPTLSNPSRVDYANAALDYVFWFAIVLLAVSVLDLATSKRFANQGHEERVLSGAGTVTES